MEAADQLTESIIKTQVTQQLRRTKYANVGALIALAVANFAWVETSIRKQAATTATLAALESVDRKSSSVTNRIDALNSEVDGLRGRLGGLDELWRQLDGKRTELERLTTEYASDIEAVKEQLANLGEEIGKFQIVVDKFSGNEGQVLVDRMSRFSDYLISDEGVERFREIREELDEVKKGKFTTIECQSLSVMKGTQPVVKAYIDKDGFGTLSTHRADGRTLCVVGASTDGNGGMFAYDQNYIPGKPASAAIFVAHNGSGAVTLANKTGINLCYMGGTANDSGGFWVFGKNGSDVRLQLSADDRDNGQIVTYNESGKVSCVMGTSTIGTGAALFYDKDGKLIRGVP